MMKIASRRSVAVSFGRRRPKRMIPWEERAPARITSPRTSRAFAKSEPRIEYWATISSPADRAKRTTKNSGRFPRVDWRTPVNAGPNRSPTASVEKETTQATPASATAATRKIATSGPPPYSSAPATSVTKATAASMIRSRVVRHASMKGSFHADPLRERLRRHDGRRRHGALERVDPRRRRLRRAGRGGRSAAGRGLREPRRRARHAGSRQHAPPPLPDPDAHPGPAVRSLQLAPRALSALEPCGPRQRIRGGAHRARRARPRRLHDGLRPPLRLPARPEGPGGGGDPGRARARRAPRRLARVHGRRRVGRRPASGRPRRGRGRRARRHGGPLRAPRARPGRLDADRRRSLLALLGLETADA